MGMSVSWENLILLAAIKARDLIFLDNISSISNNIYFWSYVILQCSMLEKGDKGKWSLCVDIGSSGTV